MDIEKVKFIFNLLNKEEISKKNKSKLSFLLIKDYLIINTALDKANEEIAFLKAEIKQISSQSDSESRVLDGCVNHSPKDTVRFLNELNRIEIYKWFFHVYDSRQPFDYEEYIDSAKRAISKRTRKIHLNKLTWKKIYNFLFGSKDPKFPDTWELINGDKMKFSWKNAREWCLQNPGYYPGNLKITKKDYQVEIDPKLNLNTFKDLIKEFKYIIEVRTDDPHRRLDIYIKKLVGSMALKDLKIEYKGDFNNVNFYTDVPQVMEGLRQIFAWCHVYKAKSNDILVSIENSTGYYILSVCHIGSGMLEHNPASEKISGCSGDLNFLRGTLYSICDFWIDSILDDGNYYQILLLSDEVRNVDQPAKFSQIEPNKGLTYNLKFYKTIDL